MRKKITGADRVDWLQAVGEVGWSRDGVWDIWERVPKHRSIRQAIDWEIRQARKEKK